MQAVCELREKYSLAVPLQISGIPRSTYYYGIQHYDDKAKKDREIYPVIKEIFQSNHRKYGYPMVKQELKNRGYRINKKRVARIMTEHRLSAAQKKRQYHSYRGQVGKISPNILSQDFQTKAPYKKLGTDVTQFITQYGQLVLSPVIDFHTREILAYDLSEAANYAQIKRMLERLLKAHGEHLKGVVLHFDQGWQYQMQQCRQFLKDNGMIQSMSRKGNCLDNSPTENFFGRMKSEIYYDREYIFQSLQHLKLVIRDYIKYYNNKRIVSRLKCSPVRYRAICMPNSI
ncbi:MAG: IS3 family transposase [Clostridia bacterium]|nr:IS3 family transposase [Clostridia bacterium]